MEDILACCESVSKQLQELLCGYLWAVSDASRMKVKDLSRFLIMSLSELQSTFRKGGRVEGICVRPARLVAPHIMSAVEAETDRGLSGDRYRQNGGGRQVTLIQAEHLEAIRSFLGLAKIDFSVTRRNLLVSGINLLALKGLRFKVGEALLEYSGECHPCSRMEEALGVGGYNAMRGHGGITARVISSGFIRTGDEVMAVV